MTAAGYGCEIEVTGFPAELINRILSNETRPINYLFF